METKICIYCGRTLDANLLIDKAGKFRCKDENNCLDYQTKEDPADSLEDADYISDVVKSSSAEAARRIAAYKAGNDDLKKEGAGDPVERSEESIAEFAWMRTVLDAFAAEYQKNRKFVFQYDKTMHNRYNILFNDEDHHSYFTVKIAHGSGSRYALIVARGDRTADADPLYQEFIYKSYPNDRREDLVQDLSVILIVLEGDQHLIPTLLYEFRSEIESGDAKESENE